MRGFEEGERVFDASRSTQPSFSGLSPSWREPKHRERIERESGRGGSCEWRTGSWNWFHPKASLEAGLDEVEAGIRQTWCAGIRHEGYLFPTFQTREDLGDARTAVVIVKTEGTRRDAEVGEQLGGAARIFRRDEVRFAQHANGPKCDVLEIADGRGDHEQRAGHRTGKLLYH